MIEMSKLFKDNLNRLNCDWSDFCDLRLKGLKKNHFKDEND